MLQKKKETHGIVEKKRDKKGKKVLTKGCEVWYISQALGKRSATHLEN